MIFLYIISFLALVAFALATREPKDPPRDLGETRVQPSFERAKSAPPKHQPPRHDHATISPLRVLKGKCWVVDGDTITIDRQNIRLFGIDAPELDHPYGKVSKSAVMRLCRGQIVTAKVWQDDHHGRLVATCYLDDGRDIAEELVKAGLAIDWPKYSGGKYRQYEPEGVRDKVWRVHARQKGLWSDAKTPPSHSAFCRRANN